MTKQLSIFSKTDKVIVNTFCCIGILCFILLALSNIIVNICGDSPKNIFIDYRYHTTFFVIRFILFIVLIILFLWGVKALFYSFIKRIKIKLLCSLLILVLFYICINNPFLYIDMGFVGWGILNTVGCFFLIYVMLANQNN